LDGMLCCRTLRHGFIHCVAVDLSKADLSVDISGTTVDVAGWLSLPETSPATSSYVGFCDAFIVT
jgi:hypothetical protein